MWQCEINLWRSRNRKRSNIKKKILFQSRSKSSIKKASNSGVGIGLTPKSPLLPSSGKYRWTIGWSEKLFLLKLNISGFWILGKCYKTHFKNIFNLQLILVAMLLPKIVLILSKNSEIFFNFYSLGQKFKTTFGKTHILEKSFLIT